MWYTTWYFRVMSNNVSVANVDRHPGTPGSHPSVTYILTLDVDTRVYAGTVTVTTIAGHDLTEVRNHFGDPEPMETLRYRHMVAAVKHYEEWAASHV